ncbi:MAG: hypothetical protein AAFR38_02820 [Planctomycetota bacterium]
MLSTGLLDSWLGMSMSDICTHGYDANNLNHCAHFVSHAMGLTFGCTCTRLVRSDSPMPGANVRVHEIFAQCRDPFELNHSPRDANHLVFVSGERNFSSRPQRMRNVPRKHIGIGFGGMVWHYSNTRDRVEKQPISAFLRHYRGQRNAVWMATAPAGARARHFGVCLA